MMMEQQQQQHEQSIQPPPLNGYGYDMLGIDAPALTPTPEPVIARVAVELVGPIWDRVEPLLEAETVELATCDTNDIRLLLMKQAAHLWIQHSGPVIEVSMLTEFIVYPKGVWLRVWLISALKGHKPDYPAIIEAFRHFAMVNKCSGIEFTGRLAWARKLANIWPECKLSGFAMRETF